MNLIIFFVVVVLIIQIALFFVIRARNKKLKRENVIEKYNIKSPGEAFELMNNPEIPEEDRIKIEKLYQGKS
ncbi:hypothetical protein QQ020_01395 [Fulvivirgaceae bacterium BMA12]|uniref:Uncharacterized protein n=1 Tax=Agaribacillus aureus TaxID=3051825 RepID=A0ABT8KYW8_9BACT|nr:hypothetical protein [Fulvivirgaceae bacterium BMA12]